MCGRLEKTRAVSINLLSQARHDETGSETEERENGKRAARRGRLYTRSPLGCHGARKRGYIWPAAHI